MQVRWRFTLRLIDAQDENISAFYPILGIRRLGRYNVEAYDYTSHSDFWSHDLYISPRFTFHARFISFELDTTPPSSEPQSDDPSLFYEDGNFYPWTGFFSETPNFFDNIGERLLLSVDSSVGSYNLGITYDWQTQSFTASRLALIGINAPNSYIM